MICITCGDETFRKIPICLTCERYQHLKFQEEVDRQLEEKKKDQEKYKRERDKYLKLKREVKK